MPLGPASLSFQNLPRRLSTMETLIHRSVASNLRTFLYSWRKYFTLIVTLPQWHHFILSGGCAFRLKPTWGSSHHPGASSDIAYIPYYPHINPWEKRNSAIIIINLYDDSAISCLASTLPNHDGQLAGLGTTSAPAGRLILILLLYQYRSIKFLREFFPVHISSYDVTLSICPTSISIPIS